MQIGAFIGTAVLVAALGLSSPAPAQTGPRDIVQSLHGLGLRPAGDKGFVQTVRYREQALIAERTSVGLGGAGAERALVVGEDLVLDMGAPQPKRLSAPLVFVGYGLPARSDGRDDFSGQDLRGKVAVFFDATPMYLSDGRTKSLRAVARSAAERAGAVGLLAVDVSDSAWRDRRAENAVVGRYLADSALHDTRGPQLVARLSPSAAERLFAAAGHDLSVLQAAARGGRPLPAFDLGSRLNATIATRVRSGASDALVALSPGSDPFLSRNAVVVSASASDADGLVHLAAATVSRGAARRSLVFALLPADLPEDLAARAVVDRFGASRDSVVAAIHLEEGRQAEAAVAGGGESSLVESAHAVAARLGLALGETRDGGGALGFALGGAPAVVVRGTSARDYVAALTREIADQAARPVWRPESPFAPPPPRAQENLTAPLEMPVGKRPQRLLPSYGALEFSIGVGIG